jgi:hypothetical protein
VRPRSRDTFKFPSCRQPNGNDYFRESGNPGRIPDELRNYPLTFVEEQVIALVSVNQYVYVNGRSGHMTSGHCINFELRAQVTQDQEPLELDSNHQSLIQTVAEQVHKSPNEQIRKNRSIPQLLIINRPKRITNRPK